MIESDVATGWNNDAGYSGGYDGGGGGDCGGGDGGGGGGDWKILLTLCEIKFYF